jgi:prepilin-type N-terminal cleavage/methylation domain-containing protein/prepilin-type processing-associated H-X9-DG protein
MRSNSRKSTGFTLVELLVVIGIIALLISILLPSLAKARKMANVVACASNLRQIVLGMQIYASQNNGCIPGSPLTTSAFLFTNPGPVGATSPFYTLNATWSNSNCPNVVSSMDWMSPIAATMGIKFDTNGSVIDRLTRYSYLEGLGVFTCPEQALQFVQYSGDTSVSGVDISYGDINATSTVVPVPALYPSYMTAGTFMWGHASVGTGGSTPSGNGTVTFSGPWYNPPQDYSPKLARVGTGSAKVFIADGARYANATTTPDVDLSMLGQGGGAFAGLGPYSAFDNCWNRADAAANIGETGVTSGPFDCRVLWARHGNNQPHGTTNSYLANFGFYDGHVETLGDLQAANPSFWAPRGSTIYATYGGSNEVWTDVQQTYFANAASDTNGQYLIAQ